jgi:uncharacterized cupin superfamily protein
MCYIVEGEADITIAGDDFHMEKGDLLNLSGHLPYSLKAHFTMIAMG